MSTIIEEQKDYIKQISTINKGKILYYCIITMGCKLNENESEKLSRNGGRNGIHKN